MKGKHTIAEADLVAVAGDVLLIAEAKSNDVLEKASSEAESVKRRVELAEMLGADEIVIATTRDKWKERSLNAIMSAIDSHSWPDGLKPRLRVVTSLAGNGRGVENEH